MRDLGGGRASYRSVPVFLFAVSDLAILWSKDKSHATVSVTISDATLAALPEILNPAQPGYHDTATVESETIGVLACPPTRAPNSHSLFG